MSLIKFELKEDHLKLLKNLQWSKTETNHLLSISGMDDDDAEDIILTPFGGDNLIQDMGDILYGKPEDFDPFNEDTDFGKVTYTDEQIEYMTELFNGITTALDICLYTQSFEVGYYKTPYHMRDWIKYEPKKNK
jgi:hypothetical protein